MLYILLSSLPHKENTKCRNHLEFLGITVIACLMTFCVIWNSACIALNISTYILFVWIYWSSWSRSARGAVPIEKLRSENTMKIGRVPIGVCQVRWISRDHRKSSCWCWSQSIVEANKVRTKLMQKFKQKSKVVFLNKYTYYTDWNFNSFSIRLTFQGY